MSEELKPLGCPFCGAAPKLIKRGVAAGYRCSPGDHFAHSYGKTPEIAAAAWNRRSPLVGSSSGSNPSDLPTE